MDYTNYYDIEKSLTCQTQRLLYFFWYGKKYWQGKTYFDDHGGWFESYEFSNAKCGIRAMARKHELIHNRNVNIKQKHIKINGEWKYIYALDCDPDTLDWKEITTNWKKWKYEE